MLRLFVGVTLPEAVRHALAELQQEMKPYTLPVKWVKPANVHLTLTFLGDTAIEKVDPIGAAMISATKGHSTIQLEAAGCGVFPRLNNPRVLWVGLKGEVVLIAEMKKALDTALAKSDVGDERKGQRAFRPHLTLGRFRHKIAPQKVAEALRVMAQKPPIPFKVGRLHLFQSTLKPQGAIYTRLRTVNLAPRGLYTAG